MNIRQSHGLYYKISYNDYSKLHQILDGMKYKILQELVN